MTRITRREFIKAAGGFVSAAVIAPGLDGLAEAARDKGLNILFLMTDQHNSNVLGCMGNPIVKTPNLDRLASQGARFTNAVCATPFCSPTRASFLTGQWPHTHGIVKNVEANGSGVNDDVVATEQILFDKGYHTAQMGKWHLGNVGDLRCYRKDAESLSPQAYRKWLDDSPGDDLLKPRDGEVQIDDVAFIPEMAKFHEVWRQEKNRSPQDLSIIGRSLRPPEYHFESWLADRCIDLIKRHKDDNFMITWSVSPPHAFWVVPDPYYSMYDPAKFPLPANWNDRPKAYENSQPARMGKLMGEKLMREYLRCYYGQVTMMDALIGRILDALEEQGLERNTLVVFTSDHGDMQAGHGMTCKSLPAYYEEIVKVPLIMRYPEAIKPGTVIETHAGSVDMMPTFLDFAGIPIPKGVQGVSLKPLVTGKASEDGRPAFCERGKDGAGWSRMIRTHEWKYAVFGKQRRELFDLQKDPYEVENLAESASHKDVIASLHKRLREQMEKTDDPAINVIGDA